jgi:putative PEP-CTERM system TPR-repeat lipoprotein
LPAAVIEFKNAVQKDPENGEIRLSLGQAYLLLGDSNSALKELERAMDAGVARERVLPPLLEAKVELGRYQEVLGELERVGALSPPLLSTRGAALLGTGDIAAARRSFEDALADRPDLGSAHLGLARVAVLENDAPGSRRIVDAGLVAAPKERRLWLFSGDLHAAARDFDAAIAAYDAAAALPGGDYLPQLGRARAMLQKGDLSGADATVEEILRVLPGWPPAEHLRGFLAFQRKDYDGAEAALLVAQKGAPDYPPVLLLLGAVKFQQSEYAQAENLLGRYLAVDPAHISARQMLAAIRVSRGDAKGAVEALAPVADRLADAEGLTLLGAVYLRAGQVSEATTALRRAAEVAPESGAVRHELALSLLASGESEGATTELQSAMALDPEFLQNDELLINLKLRARAFGEARDLAEKLIVKNDNAPSGHHLLGLAFMGLGEEEAAKAAFERALVTDPAYEPATLALVGIDLASRRGDSAKNRLDALLAASPESLQARVGLAQIALAQNDVASAKDHLATARVQHPNALAPRLLLGQVAFVSGDYRLADEVTQEALAIAPSDLDTLLARAKVELTMRGVPAAVPHANRLEDLLQGEAPAARLVALGDLQRSIGRWDRALRTYERALATAADGTPIRASMVRASVEGNDLDGARALLETLRSEGAPAHLVSSLQGDIASRAGDMDAAAKAYAAALQGGDGDAAFKLHIVEMRRGRNEAAAVIMEERLQSSPNDVRAGLALANVRLVENDYSAARALYERFQQIAPNDPMLLNNLAWLYLQQGDDRALATGRKALELAPSNPEIADTLGWILVSGDELTEAVKLLERAAANLTSNATVQYHLAAAYAKSGRAREAARAAERALSLGDFPERAEAEKLMLTAPATSS